MPRLKKKEFNPLHDTFVMALMEETGVQFTKNQAQKLLELKKKMQEMRGSEKADARENELEKSLGFSGADPGEKQPLKLTCAPESQNNRKNDDGPTCRLAVLNGRKKPLFFNPCPAPTWVQSDEDQEGQIQCLSPLAAEWVPYDHQLRLIDVLQKKSGGRRNKKELQDLFQYHRLYGGTKANLYLQKLLGESVYKCIATRQEVTTEDGQTRIENRCQPQTTKNYKGDECGALSWTPKRGVYCSVTEPVQVYAASTKLTTEESKQWLPLQEHRLKADSPKEGLPNIALHLHRLWQGNDFDQSDMDELWEAWKKHCEKRFGLLGSLSFHNDLEKIKTLEAKEREAYLTYCKLSYQSKRQFMIRRQGKKEGPVDLIQAVYPKGHIVVSWKGFTVLITRIVSGRVAQQLLFGERVNKEAEKDWPIYDANLLSKKCAHDAEGNELLFRRQLCAQILGVLESVYCESLSWRESSPFLFGQFLNTSPLRELLKEGGELDTARQRIIIRLWPEENRKEAEVQREKAEQEKKAKEKKAKEEEAAAEAVAKAQAKAEKDKEKERAALGKALAAKEGGRKLKTSPPTTLPPLPPPARPPSSPSAEASAAEELAGPPANIQRPSSPVSPAPVAPKMPKSAVPRSCLSSFVKGFAEGLSPDRDVNGAWADLRTVAEFPVALPIDAPYDPQTDETLQRGPTQELRALMTDFEKEQAKLPWMQKDTAFQKELKAAVQDALRFSDPMLHASPNDKYLMWYLIFRLVFALMETEETVRRDLLIDTLMNALSQRRDTLREEWVHDATDEDDHYRLVIKPLGHLRLKFPDWLEKIQFIPGDGNCFFTALEEHLQMRNLGHIPLLSKEKYTRVCRGAYLRGYVAAKAFLKGKRERLLELTATWQDTGASDPLGRFALNVLRMDSASFQKKHEENDLVLTSPPQFPTKPERNLALLLHSSGAHLATGHYDLLIPKQGPSNIRDVIEREARNFPVGADRDPALLESSSQQLERTHKAKRPLAEMLTEAIPLPGSVDAESTPEEDMRPEALPEKTEEAHAVLGGGLQPETKPNPASGSAGALRDAHIGEAHTGLIEPTPSASRSDDEKGMTDKPGSPPLYLPSKMEASIAVDALGNKILGELEKEFRVTGVKATATYELTSHELSQRRQRNAFFLELEAKLKEKPGELVEAEERPVVLENWNSVKWQAEKRSRYPAVLWRALLTEAQLKEAKKLARILTRTYRVSGFDSNTSMPLCDLLKIACFLPQYDLKEDKGLVEFEAGVKAISFRQGSRFFDQAVKVWKNVMDSTTKSALSAEDLRKRFCHIYVATQWLLRNGTFSPQNA